MTQETRKNKDNLGTGWVERGFVEKDAAIIQNENIKWGPTRRGLSYHTRESQLDPLRIPSCFQW